MINKNQSFFEVKLCNMKKQKLDRTGMFWQTNNATVHASFSIAWNVATAKRAHTIGETFLTLHIEKWDQVHKFPHVGKFMHLIRIKIFSLYNLFFRSLPVYTAPYIYIPGLPLQCTLPFLSMPCQLRFEPATIKLKQK